MSIFATAVNVRARQTQEDARVRAAAPGGGGEIGVEVDTPPTPPPPPPTPASIVGQLTAFVPAEMITLWAVLVGAFSMGTNGRWILLAVGMVVLVILLYLEFAQADQDARAADSGAEPVSGQRKFRAYAVAIVSFLAWSLATPGTPLDSNQSKIALAAAVVLTAIITKFAKLWGIKPVS